MYRPPSPPPKASPRASLLVHPPSYCAPYFPRVCCGKGGVVLLHVDEPGGAASAYLYANQGRSLRVHPRSFYAHHLLHVDEPGVQHPLTLTRAKGEPSHTPAVVYRPHSPPLRRASEGQRPESESKSLICEPRRGEAF
ncbi:hypothetical protein SDC9_41146 [bioreactor metagenome]|uniref:Uncharacterized protein n=1 Tax=bioreactor metagenome TaxID=1076179 RepID=A0A644VXD2_9ZZZZ